MAQEKYPPGKHPNSVAALEKHRAQKGERRNPKGRPRNAHLMTPKAREKMSQVCDMEDARKNETWIDYLVRKWFERAAESFSDFNTLLERMDGKVQFTFGAASDMPVVVDITQVVAHLAGDNGTDPH